ncbi:branched-chain amino acid transport system permease protein [Promicromonospora umidemergens]|uniref:Amino acid/amide ABC transporter membrane protein 1 (HAAT family) n=1 Tax=Promicromonospora umidemergens TaxID=629679 RepID=A0ABP8WKE9_9MICO|nr:branched-chain amino acid ABC transporter permease [Promicromonospora umidemergens]MCP2285890.1 branched-chain amino acid transport system permease protein [Promicromonospora umidemergens]
MTADRQIASAARRILAVVVAVLAGLTASAAMLAAPAAASTTDVATDCTPDGTTACVSPIVLDENNEPLPGVDVTISGQGFEEVVTSTDGPVSVAVPEVGSYTLTLDPATVPDGMQPNAAERQVTAQLGSTARGAFSITAGSAPAETGSTTEPSETADGEGASTDDEAEASGIGADGSTENVSGWPAFSQVWQQFGSGIRFGLLLALASVGLSLIYGTTGISTFSHGEQVTLGALLGFVSINWWGLPVWAAVLVTIIVCAATGWFQDVVLWGPLRRRGTPVMQLMIVTIGLSMALQYAIQMVIGGRSQRVLSSNARPVEIAGVTLSAASWLSMLVALVVIGVIAWFLTRTRIGRATRAVSDNPALAAATGINPDRIVRIVWTVSTGLAGLSGMLLAISFGSFTWTLGMILLLLMFAAVTLGGMGTAFGALAGSIVIGLVVEMSTLIPGMPSSLRYASGLLILILVLLFRPQGLLGRAVRVG